MRWDFVVLGATGMQGRIVSRDLLENGHSVLMCGRDKSRLKTLLKNYRKTDFVSVDARNINDMARVFKDSGSGVVVNCVEGDWNLHALNACLKAGLHSLDLGSEIWMTKKQFQLHDNLKRKNLTHITGCGSVPGVGNVMLAYATEKLDKVEDIKLGFAWNSNIKQFVVPFSIQSIIEEFTDITNDIHNGKIAGHFPMESLKDHSDKFVGPQKKFCVRHPEPYTFYKYYKGKGLKNVTFYAEFPPHSFDVIKMFIDTGMGSREEVNVNGVKVVPVEVLSEVLKRLQMPKGYREKEDLWVTVEGKKGSSKKTIAMQCLVDTLDGWEDAGCNIDTGMTASIMAQMIKDNTITQRGSFSPEGVVPPQPFFKELRKRKMLVYENGKKIN